MYVDPFFGRDGGGCMPKAIVFTMGEKEAGYYKAAMKYTGDPFSVCIGRAGDCDIVVPSDLPFRNTVSRSHLRFYRMGDEFWIEDQNSKNFTWVDDRIRLFPYHITLPCKLRLGNVPVQIHLRDLDPEEFEELSSFWPGHLLVDEGPLHASSSEGLDWRDVLDGMGDSATWTAALLETAQVLTHASHPDEAESALAHSLKAHMKADEFRLAFDVPVKKSTEMLRGMGLGESVHERIRKLSPDDPAFALTNRKRRQVAWGYLSTRGEGRTAALAVGRFDRKKYEGAGSREAAWLVTVALQMAIPTLHKLRDLQVFRASEDVVVQRTPSESTISLAESLGIWGTSRAFLESLFTAEVAAKRYFELQTGDKGLKTVYLQGEKGCGRSAFASLLHRLSSRKDEESLSMSIAGLDPAIAESELFGIKRGAAADVRVDRPGVFGTSKDKLAYIDEIGLLRPDVQSRLLHAISEGKYSRVGEPDTRSRTNAYLVFAADQDLGELVARKEFLPSLYARIRQLVISVPPLRRRIDDIPLLVEKRMEILNVNKTECHVRGISDQLMDAFMAYNWPYNIRELNDVLDIGVAMAAKSNEDIVQWRHLKSDHRAAILKDKTTVVRLACDTSISIKDNVTDVEREYIARALGECGGKFEKVVEQAGCNKGTVRRIEKDIRQHLDESPPEERARFEALSGEGWSRIDPDDQETD